jgi:hypothetical protein
VSRGVVVTELVREQARRLKMPGLARSFESLSRRSVLITTNLAFSEWPLVFGGDEKLTTALLDRLA